MILCTCTAFIILLAGHGNDVGEMEGIRLNAKPLGKSFRRFTVGFRLRCAISLFAFNLVVANYAYGESNLQLFKPIK